jgi:putative dimethyl sulfoxide reductase chaperone
VHEVTPNIGHDELARNATERSRLYGFLATVFRREPSAEFLCQLKTPELVVALAGAGVDLGNEFGTGNFADLAEDLAIEYTRLFLGPGKHISPHESVQLKRGSGILWGPETSAVRKAYHQAGFDIGETETDIPDHLSVELDFLALLAGEEAQAWTDRDFAQTEKFLQIQLGFISSHLGKWAAPFCAKVKDQADFPFYPAFADLLRVHLAGEKAEIAHRLRLTGSNSAPESSNPDDMHLKTITG